MTLPPLPPVYSYWEHQQFFGPAEVVIVGAGLVGLTAALRLRELKPQWRITVLERGALPTGGSTKNAGFACFGSISELIEQEQRGDLLAVVGARWEGLARLRELVGDAALAYAPVGGTEIFRAGADEALAAACRERIGYYNEKLAPLIGTNEIFRNVTARIGRLGFRGISTAIENAHEGALNAGRMMRALLARAAAADILVLTGQPVTAVAPEPDGTHIVRVPGAAIRAGRVLLATNAFARELAPKLDVTAGRGQVLVTAPLRRPVVFSTYHYDRGYTYFRPLPGGRLLLGGGRHLDFTAEATTTPGTTEPVQAYLENLLRTVIRPDETPAIEYRWSGVMGFGPALAPVLDWVRPGLLAAVRCNGMGVALGAGLGWQAAESIAKV